MIENDWGVVIQNHIYPQEDPINLVAYLRMQFFPHKVICFYNKNLLKKQNFTPHKSNDGIVYLKQKNSWW